MPRGGARPNSGPKHKWLDANGNELETKPMRVPKIITKQDIQKLIEEKSKDTDKQN